MNSAWSSSTVMLGTPRGDCTDCDCSPLQRSPEGCARSVGVTAHSEWTRHEVLQPKRADSRRLIERFTQIHSHTSMHGPPHATTVQAARPRRRTADDTRTLRDRARAMPNDAGSRGERSGSEEAGGEGGGEGGGSEGDGGEGDGGEGGGGEGGLGKGGGGEGGSGAGRGGTNHDAEHAPSERVPKPLGAICSLRATRLDCTRLNASAALWPRTALDSCRVTTEAAAAAVEVPAAAISVAAVSSVAMTAVAHAMRPRMCHL